MGFEPMIPFDISRRMRDALGRYATLLCFAEGARFELAIPFGISRHRRDALSRYAVLIDFDFRAEGARFELAIPFGIRAFQARALDRAMRPLRSKVNSQLIF